MTKPLAWKNRIIGYDTKPASWFLANPENWRIHPKPQQDALVGVLDDVGWVQDVIVNKRSDPAWGESQNVETMIDGHLRVTLALRQGDNTPVPLKYVDLTPGEEALVLATLDPIGALAAADKQKLDELLRNVQSDSAAVTEMLTNLADHAGIFDPEPDPDDLADQYGEPGERDFWPVIRLQVSPETFDKYEAVMADLPGQDEAEKFDALVSGR